MASSARHVYGPRPVGALIPGLTRPAFRRRAPAAAQVVADWPAIVGPALAAVTTPRRLQSGILTLACAGPVAMELQHLTDELLARINRHLGSQTVTRLRFVQDALTPTPAPAAPAPSPEAAAAAEKAVAAVPPGALRDALAALGRAVLTPRSPSTAATPRR
ncbi:MAG: DUF721 domain-containing protein [Alphaproteobacteria bacterium]|nr:DUF721 domain-containing protein [Alphaproteobacteria bacterium]